MIVRRLFEPGLAQASYLIGCGASGEAIVIDPNRDIDLYLRVAADEHLRITHVTETHIHADFLSGSRELAAHTGAVLHLSDEGDEHWKYAFLSEGRPLKNGDRIALGRVSIEALHTPGHTPEHLSFLVTDGAVADRPIAAATGDFIFVGDVGRPDLLERAANYVGTMEQGARTLYRALRAFDEGRDEWLQIWPGHGAGSSCGKGISAVPHSTLGYERRFNWAFRVADEAEFVAAVLAGQPEPPTYFARMKRLNKTGPASLNGFRVPDLSDPARLLPLVTAGAMVVDARSSASYAERHLVGTINIPFGGSFTTWAGWLVDAEQPLYLIVDTIADEERVRAIVRALALIGLDCVDGLFDAAALDVAISAGTAGTVAQISPDDAERALSRGELTIVDVRGESEWKDGHVPGAMHIPLGYLRDRQAELPTDRPIVVQCQAGTRSAIGASLLERAGFRQVKNLVGGLAGWKEAGLKTE